MTMTPIPGLTFNGAQVYADQGSPQKPAPSAPDDFVDRSKYTLTWSEEFDDPAETFPNAKLATCFQVGGNRQLTGNGEWQFYMDAAYGGSKGSPLGYSPFSIANSICTITAKPTPPEILPYIWHVPYVSGTLQAYPSLATTYGRFCARMKLPKGKALWPAFWALPVVSADWPPHWPPELDAMEFFGAPNNNGEGGPTLFHWGCISSNSSMSEGAWKDVGVDLTADFHVYDMEWDHDRMTWRFDGQTVNQAPTPPDFARPMSPIVNLAVGGNWPGYPDNSTPWPAALQVDFIRAYRRNA